MDNFKLGKILLDSEKITRDMLKEALVYQRQNPQLNIGQVLIENDKISEDDYYEAVASLFNTKYLKNLFVDGVNETLKFIPEKTARKFNAVPMGIDAGKLIVAMEDPGNVEAIEEFKFASGKEITAVVAKPQKIADSIDEQYANIEAQGMARDMEDQNALAGLQNEKLAEIGSRVDNTPIVKLVNTLVSQAYIRRASDIHIEPFEDYLIIRMRIDGDLQEYLRMGIASHANLISRIKILSGMNIAEKRIPLDGRFAYNYEGITIDIRVSTLPTTYGEKCVLRLLGTALSKSTTLQDLGMSEDNTKTFMRICKAPNGVILVTGPTGSGKSTTLYTVLSELNKPTVNVTTVEDPVEKKVDGINQVQTNDKAGMTFASALRSILRQDPDVIMIGECRDFETAEITMRSAITGHVVLSTLHTNDSVASISRLIDMGVEPYLVASAVNGILAQRLVKKLCPVCRKKIETPEADRLTLNDSSITHIYEPVGCPSCNFTGYSGRTAVHECIELDHEVREMVTRRAADQDIKEYYQKHGTKFLADNLKDLLKEGTTSMSEYRRTIYTTI